jgi:hypothetical protein
MSKRPALVAALLLSSCGGGGSAPTPITPPPSNAIVIGANGAVSPTELVVSPGARVLFINNHNRPHNMTSDPHPEHTDCPEINVGLLAPGQQRETQNLVAIRTCGFHDHDDDGNNALKGRIVIR